MIRRTRKASIGHIKEMMKLAKDLIIRSSVEELKSIFNNGVTFWHNPTTFLDYSQTNSIVT